jgi:hypothetical protein
MTRGLPLSERESEILNAGGLCSGNSSDRLSSTRRASHLIPDSFNSYSRSDREQQKKITAILNNINRIS